MKKAFTFLIILLVTGKVLNGQWYTKKYGVDDISYMSSEQLLSAKAYINENVVSSGFIAIGGGLCYLIFRYAKPGMSDDPSFIAELLGDEGINKLGMGCSIAAMAGGSAWWAVSMGRMSQIKSTIRARQPYTGSVSFSPVILNRTSTGNFCAGIALTITF